MEATGKNDTFITRKGSQDSRIVRTVRLFSAKFIPTNGTDFIKKNFYVGSISTPVYSYNSELSNVRYSELSFDIIER